MIAKVLHSLKQDRHLFFLLIVWVLYLPLALILIPKTGLFFIAGLIPVLVSGVYFGKRGGLLGGLIMVLSSNLLVGISTGEFLFFFQVPNYMVSVVILLLGIGLGYFHDAQRQLKAELRSREVIEHDLLVKHQEINRQKKYFEALFQNSPLAIVALDNENKIDRCNSAFFLMFEYLEREIWGKDIDDLVVPDDLKEEARSLTTTVGQGEVIHCVGKRQTKSGELLDVEIFGVPIVVEGERCGALAFYNDFTEQKRLLTEANKLQTAIEQSASPILITDIDGKNEYINRFFLELTGFSEQEVLGQSLQIFCSEKMPPDFYQFMWKTIRSGKPFSAVVTNKKKNGDLWYYDQTIQPVFASDGEIIAFISTGKDITTQINFEKVLRTSEERYRMLFEESPVALWEEDFSGIKKYLDRLHQSGITDLRTHFDAHPDEVEQMVQSVKILDVNQAVLKITGARNKNELLEKLSALATEREMEVWKEQFIALGKGDTQFEIESSHKTIQNELKNTIVRITIPPGYKNTWERVLVSLSDITEIKNIEVQLRVAKKEAEQATRAKAAFLANMSHEIRTPLNAVIGMTSLLADTALNPEQQDFVGTARSSSEALLEVINEILDFSKLEAGKVDLEQNPFDLGNLVESSLDMIASKAAAKQIELAFLMAENVPRKLQGDETHLRQILANLLSNAVKFTGQGEVVMEVYSQLLGEDRHRIHFAVRDTGIGIPADRMDRLFQSFSQVDTSTTRKYGGTGLGLTISKQLIELMGGEIWVESAFGEGSTFHFTLPFQTQGETGQPDTQAGQIDLSGKRILIVDDNETNRLILERYTRNWGMEVTLASSAKAALEVLERDQKFDTVLLDYQMPEMDGCELAGRLQVDPATKALPIVMLSSLGNKKLYANQTDLFSAYLNKPVKPSQLLGVLTALLTNSLNEAKSPKVITPNSFDPSLGITAPFKMLLVEDNPINQKVADKLLNKFGYYVDIASNGMDGMEKVEQQHYDVVFMDIQMPEMDGEEATKIIRRKNSNFKQPWIIAMTAHALEGDRERFLAKGMDDYISKPLNVAELHRVLKRIPIKDVNSDV
jgi:PAS domain S-box-containing protein